MNNPVDLTDPYKIAAFIKQAKKTTPVKAYIDGNLENIDTEIKKYGNGSFWVLFGENTEVEAFIEANKSAINKYEIEFDRRNSAIPLLDTRHIEARIEPGAVIRDMVTIHKNAVIMMGGAVLAGVLEPPSAAPVIIEDNVLVGANAVVLEGVRVGKGSVVAAGSVVTRDVEPDTVVAGIPARVIKKASEVEGDKKKLLDDLRG
ncbi:MAG: dapD [Clostridia bacterium]|nr:dapD [Clostridia bacterium]